MVVTIANVVTVLILVDVISSWVPGWGQSEPVRMVRRVTGPILEPIRRVLPPQSLGIDVSPIAAILAIQLIVNLLV